MQIILQILAWVIGIIIGGLCITWVILSIAAGIADKEHQKHFGDDEE